MKILIQIYRFFKKIIDGAILIVLGKPYRKNLKKYKKNNTNLNFHYSRNYR